jgi:hypothetical protein
MKICTLTTWIYQGDGLWRAVVGPGRQLIGKGETELEAILDLFMKRKRKGVDTPEVG